MDMIGHLCRAVLHDTRQSQRQLARRMGISLGKCHGLIHSAVEAGLVAGGEGALTLTDRGMALLERFRVDNAVIMAASLDPRFVPFARECPKSLMEIEGERIIERQITQLRARGIFDITVVVGYLAEKFEYLTDKYGVRLIFNPEYGVHDTVAGLYLARHLLGNTYLLTADHWMWDNIFQLYEPAPWFCCHWHEGPTAAWTCQTNGHRRILALGRGGRDKLALRGPVCLTRDFAHHLAALIEAAYQRGLGGEQWQTVLEGQLDRTPVYANTRHPDLVQSFCSLEALRDFAAAYAEQSGNHNLRRIAAIFDVPEGLVRNLRRLEGGMTNRSFRFELDGREYVCRVPDKDSEALVSRRQEAAVYKAVAPLGIADEIVHIDAETGVKISRFYPNQGVPPTDDWARVADCMAVLRRLHGAGLQVRHTFDIAEKLARYEALCHKAGCLRFEDFAQTRAALDTPLRIIRDCGREKVLCHMDSANNFLLLADGSLRLLDWEYGGMCHALGDVAMYGLFGDYAPAEIDRLLALYLGRPADAAERLLCYSYCAAAGLLWSLWAEYRQRQGRDYGRYAVSQYQAAKTFTRLVEALSGAGGGPA